MEKSPEYEKEVLGDCPHFGCDGHIVKDITHSLFIMSQPYCDKCGTVFRFVPPKTEIKPVKRPEDCFIGGEYAGETVGGA